MSRPLVLIQARQGGTRLPGKVEMMLGPKRMLDHVTDRVRATGLPWALCRAEDWPAVDEDDVLGRFHAMLTELDPEGDAYDPILRVTADCPLLEGWLVAHALHEYRARQPIALVATAPAWDGLDVEVMGRASLERASLLAWVARDREHAGVPFLKRHRAWHEIPLVGPALRFSVDDAEGLAFVRAVFAACEHCLAGVNHHTNAAGSIGGGDRHPVWDLHHLERGDLVECTAADLLRDRMQKEAYVSR